MFGRDTCRKTCQLEKMHGVGIEPATERDESSARGRVEIRERERFDIVKRSHEIERFRLPTTQRQRRVFDDRDTETFLKCGSRSVGGTSIPFAIVCVNATGLPVARQASSNLLTRVASAEVFAESISPSCAQRPSAARKSPCMSTTISRSSCVRRFGFMIAVRT